jgi:Xaa-Pro aminopeptidase
MVCNVEPGIYLQAEGMRHGDMVVVTANGYDLLTPFLDRPESLIV